MNLDLPAVTVGLWRADAIVPFDWLTNTRKVRRRVESQHLLSGLERREPADPSFHEAGGEPRGLVNQPGGASGCAFIGGGRAGTGARCGYLDAFTSWFPRSWSRAPSWRSSRSGHLTDASLASGRFIIVVKMASGLLSAPSWAGATNVPAHRESTDADGDAGNDDER